MGCFHRCFLLGVAYSAALSAWGGNVPHTSVRQGAQVRPQLTFACELEDGPLTALIAGSKVISDLKDLGAGVSLAILDMTPQRAAVIRQLNAANIPVTAWLLLPKEEGYFLNAGNAAAARARFDEFQAWSAANGLKWTGMGLDIEPNMEELQKLAHGGVRQLIPALLRRGFDYEGMGKAREAYQELIDRMHRRGYPVEVYQFFFMADERKAHSTLLERLLGVVDVRGDRECLMLYTSFHHSWGASVIWDYGAEAQTIVVGSTGGDSKLDAGFAPLNWDEFLRDLRAAHYWTRDIGVYSLEGCVRQGFLARLKTVDWSEASGPPTLWSGSVKVSALRSGIALVLWADRYFYLLLGCLVVVGWLVGRAVRRRRVKIRTVAGPARG